MMLTSQENGKISANYCDTNILTWFLTFEAFYWISFAVVGTQSVAVLEDSALRASLSSASRDFAEC